MDGGWDAAQAVLHPEVEDAWVPGLVKLGLLELGGRGGARVPEVAAAGRGDGWPDAREGGLEDGVEEDEGAEEPWVGEGEEGARYGELVSK